MRAMVIPEFGEADVLTLQDRPEPSPGEHDVLVEVHASAMNPVDFKIRRNGIGTERQFPFIAGYDVSGVVRARGDAVERLDVGDEVYAMPNLVRDGANAELVCVDARTAARKPANLDHAHAAALPLVTLTAWEALFDKAQIKHRQTVLIHAGGGGVGHIAVQLAKNHGCRVITTAGREESIELARQCGADVVINYPQENFAERVREETDGRGCDVVFDTVGKAVFEPSLECVAVHGRLVSIVGSVSEGAAGTLFRRNASLELVFVGAREMYGIGLEHHGQILQTVAEMVEAGRLTPHVSQTFALEDLAEAHRLQETGHVTGKVGIQVR